MGLGVAIALGALAASIAPIVGMLVVLRDKHHVDEDGRLERALERTERDLDRCRQHVRELEAEKVALMERIVHLTQPKGA